MKKAVFFAGVVRATAFAFSVAFSSQAFAFEVAAAGTVEVAFSPDEGAEDLALKLINSAQKEIRVLAYSFTSSPITNALIKATKRGVSCVLVADEKHNLQDSSGKARAALGALSTAGCDVRVTSVFQAHHDKQLLVDKLHTSTGSYNWSSAAAHKNSEQLQVNWGNPKLTEIYLRHFERNYRLSKPYKSDY